MRSVFPCVLAGCVGGIVGFSAPLQAQEIPAFAGFTLGSRRSDLALQDCGIPPSSGAPEGKQVLRCVANDSVALYFADDELYLIIVASQADLPPAERWEGMREWVTEAFGKPDTVGPPPLVYVRWRPNAARPWQLKIHLLPRWSGTLSMMEYVDCRRARAGFCADQ